MAPSVPMSCCCSYYFCWYRVVVVVVVDVALIFVDADGVSLFGVFVLSLFFWWECKF